MQYLSKKILLTALIQAVFLLTAAAQYKSFTLSDSGDTLNAIDKLDRRQGKWVVRVEELRGEPGYEEEGVYKDGKKEGVWRQYNLNSDLIAVENYKLGGKDGLQQYYTYLGDLTREEMWRAYNPDAPYDTIPVYGTGSNEIIDYKIVKAEQYSVKHGEWRYFDPQTGRLIRSEKYDRGLLEKPVAAAPVATADPAKPKKVEKTAEMLEFDKKNKGKKKVIRDGSTGL